MVVEAEESYRRGEWCRKNGPFCFALEAFVLAYSSSTGAAFILSFFDLSLLLLKFVILYN